MSETTVPETTVRETIRIASRFQGPTQSSNGGYAAGLVARRLGSPAEVTLRRPPPLDHPLLLESEDGQSRLWDGDTLIAEGRRADVSLDIPPPPTWDEACAASARSVKLDDHLLPRCFVCGPQREEGDGLRIFPGPLAALDGIYAAPWVPAPSLANGDGLVAAEYFWAALDCPGAHALYPNNLEPLLLGRLTGNILGQATPGDRCMVTSWRIGDEGRKIFAGTAIFSAARDLLAYAYAVWFKVDSFAGAAK